jgi:hypothetical protein
MAFPKIGGGMIVEIRQLPDGVDLRIRRGCGCIACVKEWGYPGLFEVWVRIPATNYQFALGDHVLLRPDRLCWRRDWCIPRDKYRKILGKRKIQ